MATRKTKNDLTNYKVLDQFREASRKNMRAFLEKKYKIIDKDGRTINLRPNASQALVFDVIERERKEGRCPALNILKSRRRGISTGITGFNFADVYNGENASGIVMTHLASVTEDLRQQMIFAYENLPDIAKMPWKHKNSEVLAWGHNNAHVRYGSAENPNFAIGRTVRQWHGSEHTRWPNFETIYKDNLQAVTDSIHAWKILESTACGTAHPSFDFWEECEKGNEAFLALFLQWWDDEDAIAPAFTSQQHQDETLEKIFSEFKQAKDRMDYYLIGKAKMDPVEAARRIAWYYDRWISCRRDLRKLCENYPMSPKEAFIASGNPYYPIDCIEDLRTKCKEGFVYDPTIRFRSVATLSKMSSVERVKDTYLEIFKFPESGVKYIAIADAATGTAKGDFSCCEIFEMATGNVVAVARGRLEVTPFADICIDLTSLYNCRLAPEAKGNGGHALVEILKYKKFNRWWYRKKPTAKGWMPTHELGWDTNLQTRPIMLEQSKAFMRERINSGATLDFIPSAHILDEMRTFVDDNGKPQAQGKKKDDMVVTWAIGITICLIETGRGNIEAGLLQDSHGNTEDAPLIITPKQTLSMIKNPNWTGQSYNDFSRSSNGFKFLDR